MTARRIGRILELRERALQDARAKLEAATTKTLEANIALAQRRADAERAENAVSELEAPCAGDLVVASAHIASCQRKIVLAANELAACAAAEARARGAVNDARIKVRQIEIWREHALARANAAAEVEERKLHDALAARGARSDR